MKQRQPKLNESFLERYLAQILVTPSTLVIFGVMFVPIAFALYMSLNGISFKGAETIYTFVGLGNYIDIFTSDPWFLESLLVTILFTLVTVAAEMVLGVGIALVLNKEFHGRGFVRGLMILPWAMPTVVNGVMWKWILNSDYGALNAFLVNLGIIEENVNWLGTPAGAFMSVLAANVWKETPYVVLLTIAALATIPKDLYEAGSIDGAGGWRAFWRITLPLMKPVILILAITKTIWAFQTFDLIAIMTSGGPENSTNLLSYYIHRVAFKMTKFGLAGAMSYTLSLVCFVLTYLYIKIFMGDDRKALNKRKMKREQRKLVA